MKSIIISIALTIVMAITVVCSSLYVSSTLSHLEDRIDEYDTKKAFYEIAEDFRSMLDEYRHEVGFLSLLLADSLIGEIENGFLDVISYAECEDTSGVVSSAERLHANIEGVRVLTEFSLRSIF